MARSMRKDDSIQTHDAMLSMRIDKWLWAARFFRTRSAAKDAIEGGKVHYQGDRVKVSKDVRVGMELTIRQGFDEKTVEVKALSEHRGGAPAAQLLYEETAPSIAKRDLISSHRKRDRRQIHRFQQDHVQGKQGGYDSGDEGY
jgi:ribosome-associated heat shock protein Hsp15